MNLFGMDPAWGWLLVAGLLALLELLVPGVFLVWLAAAAALTGAATLLFGPPLVVQVLLFGLFSIGAVLAGAQIYRRSSQSSDDPLLNDRTARLIGRTVTVETAIEGGEGRVRVGDSVWTARGPDAEAGVRVRIVGAEGGCLSVLPVAALPGPDAD